MELRGLKEFDEAFRRFSKKQIPEVVKAATTKIVLDVLRGAVEKTPVDTGRARGGWQVSIGSLPGPTSLKDKNGGRVMSKGTNVAALAPPYSIMFISNSVNYIEVLEYGKFTPPNPGPSSIRFPSGRKIPGKTGEVLVENGYHIQAPRGMLGVTTQEVIIRSTAELRAL